MPSVNIILPILASSFPHWQDFSWGASFHMYNWPCSGPLQKSTQERKKGEGVTREEEEKEILSDKVINRVLTTAALSSD